MFKTRSNYNMVFYYIHRPTPTQRCYLQLMAQLPVLKLLFLQLIFGVSSTEVVQLQNAGVWVVHIEPHSWLQLQTGQMKLSAAQLQ